MIITNALLERGLCTIELKGGRIADVRPGTTQCADLDAGGRPVVPGLIDIHFHGALGIDCLEGQFEPLGRYLAGRGITAWLPTLSTAAFDRYRAAASGHSEGAVSLGLHLEGPFLSEGKKGAQNGIWLQKPDLASLRSVPGVKMITVAPELPGALEMIREADCLVSLGHTQCDHKTALAAFDNGANCLTHIFNAMPPMLHRDPGPIGAAIERQAYAQLICDGIHVHKSVVLAAYRMFGPERLILISDCIPPAGMPEGTCDSAGLPVAFRDGALRLEDGTIAGSGISLWDGMRKAVEFGIPFWDAVRMASTTPAELLGVNKGRIETGYDADLVLTDENGSPGTVIIDGKIFLG